MRQGPAMVVRGTTIGDLTLAAIIRVVLNTRDDVAFARFFDALPKLPRSAFSLIVAASRASRVPLWPTIMSFVIRTQLGGGGYRPEDKHPLQCCKPGVMGMSQLVQTLQTYALDDMAGRLNQATASQQTAELVGEAVGDLMQIAVKIISKSGSATLTRVALAAAKKRMCHNAAVLSKVLPPPQCGDQHERLDKWVMQSMADLEVASPGRVFGSHLLRHATGERATSRPDASADAGAGNEMSAVAWFGNVNDQRAPTASQLELYCDAYAPEAEAEQPPPPSSAERRLVRARSKAAAAAAEQARKFCPAEAPRKPGERIGDVIRWDRGVGNGTGVDEELLLIKRKRGALTPVKSAPKQKTKRRPSTKSKRAVNFCSEAAAGGGGPNPAANGDENGAPTAKTLSKTAVKAAAARIRRASKKINDRASKDSGKKSSGKGTHATRAKKTKKTKKAIPLGRGQKTLSSLWGAFSKT